MLANVNTIVTSLWIIAGVVWVVGAFAVKRTVRTQSASSRLFHLSLAVLAFTIGFTRFFPFEVLDRLFLPASPVVACMGLLLVSIGIGFAIWARLILGRNWSGTVTVKEDHSLIRRGPYSLVRHPIYSGLLLAVLGTVIAFREIRGLVAAAFVVVLLFLKTRIEERFMTERFGTEYEEYRRQVKALIPFLY